MKTKREATSLNISVIKIMLVVKEKCTVIYFYSLLKIISYIEKILN